nr:Cof-type HAD-IIB family hydrolase [Anaerostipes faecalis]
MKNVKLIALDLDGTTFNSRKEISSRTKQVIADAISHGVCVLPATGRPRSFLPVELLDIPGIRYAAVSNGSSVVDLTQDKPLYEDLMSASKIPDVLKKLRDLPVIIELFFNGSCYADKGHSEKMQSILDAFPDIARFQTPRIFKENLLDQLISNPFPLEKIHLLFADLSLRQEILDFYKEEDFWDVTSAFRGNLELTSKTAKKGNAILKLAQILDIKPEETMAIGDSFNDLDMLNAVGFSVAMGNAEPEVKEIADFITKSNDEDGVAYAIEKFAF